MPYKKSTNTTAVLLPRYNDEKLMMCLLLLKKLKMLKQSAAKAKTRVERSTYNKQMKEIIQQLEALQ